MKRKEEKGWERERRRDRGGREGEAREEEEVIANIFHHRN